MGIGKRKNFKTFWPNGDFCPVGTGKNKVSDSLDQTAVFVKGVLGDEKISDSFVQSGSSWTGEKWKEKIFSFFRPNRHLVSVG